MEEQNHLQFNNFILISQNKNYKNKRSRIKSLSKSIYDAYNLNKIGSIKFAKIHRSANRPLYKNKNKSFNKDTEFCQCCNLPAEQKDILEKFNFCDDPEKFIECGEGVSLYFTFFKFAMIIMFITFLLGSLCNIVFSKFYYEEINDICNNKYNNLFFKENCTLYLNDIKNNTYSNSLISNSYFFMFNNINIKYYKNIYKSLYLDRVKVDSSIVNTSFTNLYLI